MSDDGAKAWTSKIQRAGTARYGGEAAEGEAPLLPRNRRNLSKRRLRGRLRAAGATQAEMDRFPRTGGVRACGGEGRYPHHAGTAAAAVPARIGRTTQTLSGTA